MLTGTQKSAAEAIVNIFETGHALGHYGSVTLLKGDSGHLTYGRTQTTLTSGNLFLLIKDYVDADGAEYADHFKPFLARLRAIDLSLDNDRIIKELLQQAGSDPVMHQVQDAFFDRVYWNPALVCATELGIVSALGCCTVYDSMVSRQLAHDARSNQRAIRSVQDARREHLDRKICFGSPAMAGR